MGKLILMGKDRRKLTTEELQLSIVSIERTSIHNNIGGGILLGVCLGYKGWVD